MYSKKTSFDKFYTEMKVFRGTIPVALNLASGRGKIKSPNYTSIIPYLSKIAILIILVCTNMLLNKTQSMSWRRVY